MTRRIWSQRTKNQYMNSDSHGAWTAVPYVAQAAKMAVIKPLEIYEQHLYDMPKGDLVHEGDLWRNLPHFHEVLLSTAGKDFDPLVTPLTVARFSVEKWILSPLERCLIGLGTDMGNEDEVKKGMKFARTQTLQQFHLFSLAGWLQSTYYTKPEYQPKEIHPGLILDYTTAWYKPFVSCDPSDSSSTYTLLYNAWRGLIIAAKKEAPNWTPYQWLMSTRFGLDLVSDVRKKM